LGVLYGGYILCSNGMWLLSVKDLLYNGVGPFTFDR